MDAFSLIFAPTAPAPFSVARGAGDMHAALYASSHSSAVSTEFEVFRVMADHISESWVLGLFTAEAIVLLPTA